MAKDKRPPQRRREPDTQEINRTSEDVEQNLQRDGLGPDALQMMQRAQQPMQPTQGAQEPIPAAQVLAEKPAARRMTQERVRKAMDTLLKYKAGKARLESRLVEVEQWWTMRHWEWMQEQGAKGDMQTASAWLFNVIISKHADGIQSIPEANVLPREESDRETARSLSAIIPCVLEQNEFDATYSDVLWQKLKGGTGAYGVFWDKRRIEASVNQRLELLRLVAAQRIVKAIHVVLRAKKRVHTSDGSRSVFCCIGLPGDELHPAAGSLRIPLLHTLDACGGALDRRTSRKHNRAYR